MKCQTKIKLSLFLVVVTLCVSGCPEVKFGGLAELDREEQSRSRNGRLSDADFSPVALQEHPKFIAHAAGGVSGTTYTNAQEALDEHYSQGQRFFEIDFSWTKDGRLALIHDWKQTYRRLFGGDGSPPALEEFLAADMLRGLTQLSIDGLAEWLESHPDAFIITDVKNRNLAALARLNDRYARYCPRIIPQIYNRDEYEPVKALGFSRIIFTLYRSNASDKEILAFVADQPVFAVAMPAKRAIESNLALLLRGQGVIVYAHTVNDPKLVDHLGERGVHGVYTDFLMPAGEQSPVNKDGRLTRPK
jgi:glycerophosphoryl diester phosphodiesterase